jgi:hypothetical protein
MISRIARTRGGRGGHFIQRLGEGEGALFSTISGLHVPPRLNIDSLSTWDVAVTFRPDCRACMRSPATSTKNARVQHLHRPTIPHTQTYVLKDTKSVWLAHLLGSTSAFLIRVASPPGTCRSSISAISVLLSFGRSIPGSCRQVKPFRGNISRPRI